MMQWKVYPFVFAATIFESVGDTILRLALGSPSMGARIGLFVVGSALLTLYGTMLNLAPVEFHVVVGIYIGMLFVMFQITNFLVLKHVPTVQSLVGGVFILIGAAIIALWR